MILQSKSRGGALLVAGLILAAGPVWSQEEAGEDEGRPEHSLSFDIERWVVTPSGMELSPASQAEPGISVGSEQLNTKLESEAADRYGIGFRLPGDNGNVVGVYQSLGFDSSEQTLRPGEFIFTQSLSYPLYAGVDNDGFADGFLYNTSNTLREWFIGYERRAFRTQKVTGRWMLGWRRSKHRRNQDANYYSVISPLPPLLPPTSDCAGIAVPVDGGEILNCNLTPVPDTASLGSTFNGRGPMARLEVDVNLWRDKLTLETGLALSVIRGKLDADFIGSNSFYFCNTEGENNPDVLAACPPNHVLSSPWNEISDIVPVQGGDPIRISDFVVQSTMPVGIRTESESASSNVIDTFIAIRWRALNWFEVNGGWRSSRYEDVGLDLIPAEVTTSVSGAVGVPVLTTKKTSVTYEGFYLGVTFRAF